MPIEPEKPCAVLMTAGSEEEALKVARALVEERLAACCSLIPRIRSVYRWQGKICDDAETMMIAKTTGACLHELVERVKGLHSYDCPEVVALEITGGAEAYLGWLSEECGK